MRYFRIAALLVPILAGDYASAADQPSSLVVLAPASGDIACASPGALASIRHRFARAERTQWHRGFVMQAIDNPRPSGHPYAEPGLVKRDYCVADSLMTDGTARPVYFTIEHGLGFVGIGRDIEFCVLGLDPWHVHDGDCRTVR